MLFILGLIVFFAPHVFAALAHGGRDALVRQMGEPAFKGLFSIVSAAGLALIIVGWRSADASILYTPPAWTRHITYALMLLSFIALAAAYLPKGRVAAALKHPMLAGVKLWAFGHLLANGEVRSVILFGAFLLFGIVDRIAVKRRGAPTAPAGPAVNDLYSVLAGAGLWALVYFYAHPLIAGVALR